MIELKIGDKVRRPDIDGATDIKTISNEKLLDYFNYLQDSGIKIVRVEE